MKQPLDTTPDPLATLGVEAEMLQTILDPLSFPYIWIVGGYKGKTALAISKAWPDAELDVFEPQHWAAVESANNCYSNPNIRVLPFGLGDDELKGPLPMGEWANDACSMLPSPNQRNWGIGDGWFIDAEEIAAKMEYDAAVCVMNCEGGELVILPRLIKTGLICNFKHLLIQFHTEYRGEVEVNAVTLALSKTHDLQSADGYSWQHWERKQTADWRSVTS